MPAATRNRRKRRSDAERFQSLPGEPGFRYDHYENPLRVLAVVRVTYACMRRTFRPMGEAAAYILAAKLTKSEGRYCRVEVLPAIGNWREPERVK